MHSVSVYPSRKASCLPQPAIARASQYNTTTAALAAMSGAETMERGRSAAGIGMTLGYTSSELTSGDMSICRFDSCPFHPTKTKEDAGYIGEAHMLEAISINPKCGRKRYRPQSLQNVPNGKAEVAQPVAATTHPHERMVREMSEAVGSCIGWREFSGFLLIFGMLALIIGVLVWWARSEQ